MTYNDEQSTTILYKVLKIFTIYILTTIANLWDPIDWIYRRYILLYFEILFRQPGGGPYWPKHVTLLK